MIRRLVEAVLIAAVVDGGFFAWRTGVERAALGVEFARLARAAGDLEITDPAKVHVLALDTGEPYHYAWRIYLPANYDFKTRTNLGNRSSSASAKPVEFIARVRLREDPRTGEFRIFESHHGSSGVSTLDDNTFGDRFRKHAGEVVADRLGATGLAVIDPKDPAVLLRLSFPPGPRAEATKPSPPDFYRLEFGPIKPPKPEGEATP